MKKVLLIIMCFIAMQLGAQTITNYTTADGLVDNFVECIDIDVNDSLWIGTSVGVQMFSGSSGTVYDMVNYPGMLSDNIKVISGTSTGDIWIGTDYGASKLTAGFSGMFWLSYTTTDGLISNQVKSIDEDVNGGIWIGTNQGVSYFDGNSWISYSSPDLHWSGVNAIAFDLNGDKWFASPLGGVTHFDGATFTNYDTSNGLLSQNVTALLIDNQDNKWIGTDLGMSVLNASNSSFIDYIEMYPLPPPHDSINPVVDIAMDSYGRIWTAIYVGYLAEGGIAMWDGNQWFDFDVSDGLIGPNVRGLAIDSQDNVWVATSAGVSKISSIPSTVSNISNSVVEVYPNPTLGKVYINTQSENFNTIAVYNNIGSLVYSENLKCQQKIEIDFSSLTKGLYHINLHSDKGVENHKLLIK
ncbi:MAG TPA: T9SS type A sorting domain-containing protein [Flavobacteriales bacterium]|nr:T9SS type A sorting domain-containing protein [Flavobacteriales bacterium]